MGRQKYVIVKDVKRSQNGFSKPEVQYYRCTFINYIGQKIINHRKVRKKNPYEYYDNKYVPGELSYFIIKNKMSKFNSVKLYNVCH